MKKNPIDELFASKLKEHRLEPSQRALDRFNERLDQKNGRKIAPWYFGAAASIALASFGLYIFNQNEKPVSLAVNKEVKVDNQSKTSNNFQPILENKIENVIQVAKTPNISLSKFEKEEENIFVNERVNFSDVIVEEKIIEVAQIQELQKEEHLIEDSKEVFENGTLKPSSLPQILNHQVEEDIILTYEVEKMPQERLRRFDEEPIGLAQAIQFEEYYFLHKKESESFEEPTILTKIGRQFQHLKKGEKVNFRELGLRPRDIFAKADKFIHEELGIENSIKSNKNIQSFGN